MSRPHTINSCGNRFDYFESFKVSFTPFDLRRRCVVRELKVTGILMPPFSIGAGEGCSRTQLK